MKKKNFLVTRDTGFIGAVVANKLLDDLRAIPTMLTL